LAAPTTASAEKFLTGVVNFKVKEIEVFEIADEKAFPANREK
jgi:hypothetical protein